jgi:secretion/DNA translocation related CpaE-like protein
MDQRTRSHALVVITADAELLDHVLSVTAAVGVEPQVASDPGAVRPWWTSASTVLVGVDQAGAVAAMVLPRRAEVYLVGLDHDRDDVLGWSMPLGAAILTLPSGASRLATALTDASGQRTGKGRLVCVVGGSGGVGASTLAAGLAVVGVRMARRAMLVDADPLGGGVDLLVGAERVDGWRWPRLASARGHLGDLTGQLPQVDGVDVLSMARDAPERGPDAEQMTSVLLSALRSHRLTVVDVPRSLGPAAREAVRRADQVLLLVQADVRGVAAGRAMVDQLDQACRELALVVRSGRARSLAPDTVAAGLGLALLGSVADDPGLILAAESGDPPARSSRSPLARTCRMILDPLLAEQAAA